MGVTPRRPGPIAFFLPTLCGGGAERVAVNLAEGMASRGHAVDLVVATAEGELAGEVPPAVRLVDLKAGRVLRSLPSLASYLRREQPRVVLSSMGHANIVSLWAARVAGRGTPVVVTVHNTMSQSGREQGAAGARVWAGLMRTFYPWAAEIVAVSEGAATDLARTTGLPRERVRVVYNPVITSALLSRAAGASEHPWLAPGQPPVVLGVGRLTSQKNFALLLHAFATVRRARETRLLILGEGEQRSELEALAVRLGIAGDVALPGFRDDAAACMAGAAVFVLSSAWEGLPTVLIEALAVGTRVVSTDCPSGPREILQDGRLGALVPVGDADALARALLRTLEQPRTPVPAEALAPFMSSAAVDRYLSLIGSHP